MTQPRFADVMLLAAGLGKRMLPLTETLPKPLITVGGIALLDRVIDNAAADGATHFVVNTHHHAAQIADHVETLRKTRPTLSFALSPEPEQLLDTGGGVKQALPLLRTDPILVLNTDAFWPAGTDQPLARMAKVFAERSADLVLLCAHPRRATGFRRSHDFCLDPHGRITLDTGAPVIYAGAALIAKKLFDGTPDGPFSLYTVFERALEAGTIFGVALDAPWLHVGDPQALAEAEALLAQVA
ncbi:MAG TPA: nucleotidyltransferase family protein [Arsenicitalea sp.]|nr:nucleotidyltransferase family protein [Arsenicitalea sp.]